MSKICGVALFSASCSSQPAFRRGVPHSDMPAAVPTNGEISTVRVEVSTVCHTRVRLPISLRGEGFDVGGGNPRCPRRAVMSEVLRLHALQCRDVTRVRRMALGGRLSDRQLGADAAREGHVVGLPGLGCRVTEDGLAELGGGRGGFVVCSCVPGEPQGLLRTQMHMALH